MPPLPRKLLGAILLISAIGIAAWQTLATSCSASPSVAASSASPLSGT
ncbi:hypothetical protein [Thiocapsa imhoffii]|nr:hypothetical protein [Thiocapsa imhoffii]